VTHASGFEPLRRGELEGARDEDVMKNAVAYLTLFMKPAKPIETGEAEEAAAKPKAGCSDLVGPMGSSHRRLPAHA
jgi:hypothetical protein